MIFLDVVMSVPDQIVFTAIRTALTYVLFYLIYYQDSHNCKSNGILLNLSALEIIYML